MTLYDPKLPVGARVMTPKRSDPTESVSLHPLELRILLVVLASPAHGYRIVKEVEALEGGRFTLYPANLYRRIRDLSRRGLLAEVGAPRGTSTSDRPRTYFGATPLGREVVHGEVARLEKLLRDARATLRPA